jgi:hypothetical protein
MLKQSGFVLEREALEKVVGRSAVNYTFRPMTIQDFAMARRWLETPEVRRWWRDPDGEVSLLEEYPR